MKKIIQLVALTLTLAGAAFAQLLPVDTIPTEVISYTGNQTGDGKFISELNQTTANSFVLNGYNSSYSSLLLTVSFDYAGEPNFESGNHVVGGTWNMGVYSNGTYIGSIFGEVLNGQVMWSVNRGRSAKSFSSGGSKTTEAYLRVNGGTGDFEGFTARYDPYIKVETDMDTGVADTTLKDFVF